MYDAFATSELGARWARGAPAGCRGASARLACTTSSRRDGPRVQLSADAWAAIETRFMAEMAAAVASGKYPRLKAYVYYDAGHSAVYSRTPAEQVPRVPPPPHLLATTAGGARLPRPL